MSSASLILTDRSLALSEPKAVGAQGSTKVLVASSLGSCLVFVSGAVVTVALAAIGQDMRLSPLDLQWVMNAEFLPLAALTLVAGVLGDRFGQKRSGATTGYIARPRCLSWSAFTVICGLRARHIRGLAELKEDKLALTQRMRQTRNVCDEHGDVATASLIENWIDEAERRTWFLFETTRKA